MEKFWFLCISEPVYLQGMIWVLTPSAMLLCLRLAYIVLPQGNNLFLIREQFIFSAYLVFRLFFLISL